MAMNNDSKVQISKPRIAIILVVYALGLWVALQFCLLCTVILHTTVSTRTR